MTMTDHAVRCRSHRSFVSLGPVPPRTPGRTDAQVPRSLDDGPVRYARLSHLYFYVEDEQKSGKDKRDAAFGFVDIEVSVQRLGRDRFDVELYCAGDGYQSGSGAHRDGGLRFEFHANGQSLGKVAWPFPDIRSGTSDPLTYRAELTMSDVDFDRIDALVVPPAPALCHIDLDD